VKLLSKSPTTKARANSLDCTEVLPRICGLCILALATAASALAQSSTTTYTPDLLNGGFIPLTTSDSSDHTQTQITQSLNGRAVPLEQHEERVLSRAADGTVTSETIVRKYDPTGGLASTERTVTEQRKTPDGGSLVKSTTYRSDVNGDQQAAERRTVDTRVSGSTTAVNTVVDRPSLDGAFQTAEKRTELTNVVESSAAKKSTTTTESVYRGNPSDGFTEAERKVITETQAGDQTVVNTMLYQPGGVAGALQFQEQRVATVTAATNGSQTTRIDVYAPAAYGQTQDSGSPPQLNQEQIITQEKRADGSVAQTFSVRETSVSEATHLGPPRIITETVCTGKCDGSAAPVRAPVPDVAAKP
jgi:hypothetical protein